METAADTGLRATLAVSDKGPQGLIVIEDRPSRHALTFSAPHEASTLDLVAQHFEQSWRRGVARPHTGLMPNIVPIPLEDLFGALRSNVRQYAKAEFSMANLSPTEIARLTSEVEIFKLRRVASTLRILNLCGRDEPLSIEGTPWGLFPPIVEQDASGAYTLIDGVHRLFMSSQRETIPVVLVRNVSAALPAKPTRNAPRIVAGRSPRDERYDEYSGLNFRDIKKALERGAWASV